ncbi:alpha/beta hydrolase [Salinisphaera sp. Q1T1-3]|uniref:alpha/beta hydrolase n=1 Tax=Salinisphaera sp. Q1T1-3 TaxID=2321229 RepID=UPI000E750C77|nr:alpha/beta hydrolase [Salinisphaera sp. Q1T1-3]RJS93030.1 alpha/beta hydrolase [Salinisphaera sp. Q1T1-3]
MTLTPEVAAIVKKMRSAEISFTDLGLADARQLYIDTLARSGGTPVAMASIVDVALALPGRTITARRYRPKALAESPAPTLVYFHGGGWVLGDLASHDRICRQLAERAGCQLIAIDYRLAPEHCLPAASADAIEAYAHLVEHAADHDIDADRLAVGGDSAGGHLSAVVALAARDAGWPLARQVLIYPATDLRPAAAYYPSRGRNGDVPPLTADLMDWFGQRSVDANTDALDWRVSPMLADALAGTAPALVITAGADVLMDEGTLYAARLADAGVAVEHAHYPGVIHGFIEMAAWLSVTGQAMDRIADTLHAVFHPAHMRD